MYELVKLSELTHSPVCVDTLKDGTFVPAVSADDIVNDANRPLVNRLRRSMF